MDICKNSDELNKKYHQYFDTNTNKFIDSNRNVGFSWIMSIQTANEKINLINQIIMGIKNSWVTIHAANFQRIQNEHSDIMYSICYGRITNVKYA